jgi:hypothetical protein
MIETIALLVVLLSVSLILCWGAKPRKDTEWKGEQAADMAGGLIIAAAAIGNLWLQISGNESAILLLDSLAWYAALPLLITVRMIQAAQHLGFDWHWDRIIWGRILLALCAVFEVCRRANQLDVIIYVASVIGCVSFLILALRPILNPLLIIITGLWIGISVAYLALRPSEFIYLLAPLAIVTATTLSKKNYDTSC